LEEDLARFGPKTCNETTAVHPPDGSDVAIFPVLSTPLIRWPIFRKSGANWFSRQGKLDHATSRCLIAQGAIKDRAPYRAVHRNCRREPAGSRRLTFIELGRRSGISSDRLRRLSECSEKSATHPFPVTEAGLLCNHIHRMTPLLHQEPGCFDAQILHRLRR
jgi:hypothetical protein